MKVVVAFLGMVITALLGGMGTFAWMYKNAAKRMETSSSTDDDDEYSAVPFHISSGPRTPVDEHGEALEMTNSNVESNIRMHTIHLGDLCVQCPVCEAEVDAIQVGIGSLENTESDGDINDILSIGVVAYYCGHVIHSPCLLEKVANILNGEEIGVLAPSLFANIAYCEEHDGATEEES